MAGRAERIDKRGETADPGHPQPEAAEVESARLMENEARERLRAAGLTDEQIRRLADEFVARHLGESVDDFVSWAKQNAERAGDV